jgi:hypothetical protein
MRPIVVLLIALLVLAPTGSLRAQGETLGALEGTIHERSPYRSVMTARLTVRRVEPDSSVSATAALDAQGRYRLDSLPPGRYRARVASAALDSLRVAPPSTDVQIVANRVVLADFTLPSGMALRASVCGDTRLEERRGAVAGYAIDADADGRPLVGAEVVGVWMEFPLNRVTGRSVPTRRVVVVKTGQAGEYRVCGVPTETLFTLQLRSAGRASAVVQLLIADGQGVIARDLSLSERTAPTVAALDSIARVAAARGRTEASVELQAVGAAEVAGVVRGLSGAPFAGAQVRVRNARASTVTDSAGRFVLGDLPGGTQMLIVQHPGYAPSEVPVELRAGKRVELPVLLVRPLTLEAIQTTASAEDLEAFDASRRTNRSGQFLTKEHIDKKKHVTETVDLFDDVLGFTAFGHGDSARVISNMALEKNASCTGASVIVQGVEGRRINDVKPGQIAGIEAYADPAFVPARFAGRADCGVVVIWLRKRTRSTSAPAAGLRVNGYP